MSALVADPDAFAGRLRDVRSRVESHGGDPGRIRIVAVTKGFGPGAVAAARSAGIDDLGENYAQELVSKATGVPPGAVWHFLGPVQRNKVPRLAPLVRVWHGIDRRSAAEAVGAACPGAEVFVQVNVTGQPGRPGCEPARVDELAGEIEKLPVRLSGLMAVGTAGDLEATRRSFRWLAGKAVELGLGELSMGMSDDFEVAVEEGATTLRLGRVLFGTRPGSQKVQR